MNMFNLNRIETIPLPSKVETAYSVDVSQTGHISITTSAYILIYQVIPSKECNSKELVCRKFFIWPSGYTLKDDLGINIKDFLYDLPREQYYECILSGDLTPDLDIVQPYTVRFLKSMWSPPRCDRNYDCVLATITNNGIVEIYVKIYDVNYSSEFKLVSNMTKLYAETLKGSWEDVSDLQCSQKLEILRKRADELKTKCLTWSSCTSEGYYILILGHFSGKISFWKVNGQKENSQFEVEFICMYETDVIHITCLTWKQTVNGGFLFVGSKDGCTRTLKITVSASELIIEKHLLEIQNDGSKVNSINIINTKYGYILLIVKVTTIIIVPFDILSESYEFACDNLEILDVVIAENHILILTKTGVVKEMIISIIKSKLDIKWRHFYIDLNTYVKAPICMSASPNKTLIFVLTKHCKPKILKIQTCVIDLHVFGNNECKCLEYLYQSPWQQLTYMWDYLELYRCSAIQTKNLNLSHIKIQQHYDLYDFYQLKVLLNVSKIIESMSEQLDEIPTIKTYEETLKIFYLKMALLRMHNMLERHKKTFKLSEFEHQNLMILSNYIKQIVVEDAVTVLDLHSSTMETIIDIMQKVDNVTTTDINWNCEGCNEKIYDVSCMPPHFGTRCSVSLMPIYGIAKYKCVMCNCVAHEEILREVKRIVCPFCDLPMMKRPEGVDISTVSAISTREVVLKK